MSRFHLLPVGRLSQNVAVPPSAGSTHPPSLSVQLSTVASYQVYPVLKYSQVSKPITRT